MSRHINWSFIIFGAALIVLAASSPAWLETFAPDQAGQAADAFPCPPAFLPDVCILLEEIDEENPLEAEAMIGALQAEPIPAPANENTIESLETIYDRDSVSVFSLTRVRTGQFTELDILHRAEGTANIWEIVADEEITRYVRFEEDFTVTRGPDLRVYLSINSEPRTREEVFASNTAIELGVLKGNTGGQNYRLDERIDITQYRSVVIFSTQYGTVFSTAPLQQPIQ